MNAISVDGFIAKPDGDSDWVVDDDQFDAAIAEFGCLLIGHNTFKQYEGDLYPIDGAVTFVYSSVPTESTYENVKFVTGTPQEVLDKITTAGFNKVLLAGGGKVNGSFAKAGLITEMILDVHPLVLGDGIKLLGDFSGQLGLEFVGQKNFEQFIQLHYKTN